MNSGTTSTVPSPRIAVPIPLSVKRGSSMFRRCPGLFNHPCIAAAATSGIPLTNS
jgi:hypothetical protein